MKSRWGQLITIIAALGLIFGYSCRSSVKKNVYENPSTHHKILITGTTSDFKQVVVDGIVQKYQQRCQIEVLPARQLRAKDFDACSAIIIMDECRAWMAFNVSTMKLVKKIKDKDKIILFITAGDPDWEYSAEGIDAITSASEEGKEGEVIEKISQRIDDLIK